MITIAKARKVLGEDSKDLSDQEIQELLDQLHALADVALATPELSQRWLKTLKE